MFTPTPIGNPLDVSDTTRIEWHSITRPLLFVIGALVVAYVVSAGSLVQVALVCVDVVLVAVTAAVIRAGRANSWLGTAWIVAIIALLIGVKLLPLTSGGVTGAGGTPLGWIGFSYLAFRLLHLIFDARAGKSSDATFGESTAYVLNPATLIAGPIDRLPRNLIEQRQIYPAADRIRDGLWRIALGLFKKLVLANSLFVLVSAYDVARNPTYAMPVAWVWLIAYAFYLYFDFAAYSDMAVGVSGLLGIRLPENFANPYAQPNLTKFWNSWHITLSAWLRDYVFFPISRGLMQRSQRRHQTAIMLTAQLTTMLICGLWHGVSLNFMVWGLWHGIGLFATAQTITLWRRMGFRPLPALAGVPITFLYVCVGWIFFATPDLDTALQVAARLIGR